MQGVAGAGGAGRAAGRRDLLAACALAALVIAALLPVLGNGFVGIDDPEYVTENPRVLAGPTAGSLAWALTAVHSFNWHPLTWVSHMVDARLFGADPAGHHATSLLLHAGNTVLVYALVRALSGAAGRAFAVALLFGLHPLRVESVAWVAERKDVLSAFLGLGALLAWTAWLRRRRPAARVAAIALFAASLLSKQMLVTLPLLLLLLDFWPLGRWRGAASPPGTARRLLLEEAPFIALAAAASVAAFRVQAATGAVRSLEDFPAWVRAANTPLALAGYLRRALWPAGLAMPYPHPGRGVDIGLSVLTAAALAALTLLLVARWRRRPAAAAGWLWFLVAVSPVVGIVQIAGQALADRYTYLPLLGPAIGAVWLAADRLRGWRRGALAGAVAVLLVAPALGSLAWRQARVWHDDLALFGHAVAADPGNWMARTNLGATLQRQGRGREAIGELEAAFRLNPAYPDAAYNLGVALLGAGRLPEAIARFEEVLRRLPSDPDTHVNLATALARSGRTHEAAGHLALALRVRPGSAEAHNNLGVVLLELGRREEAVAHFREALALRPGFRDAGENLRAALAARP